MLVLLLWLLFTVAAAIIDGVISTADDDDDDGDGFGVIGANVNVSARVWCLFAPIHAA